MKKSNNSRKLRHPSSYPASERWMLEGCAETLKSLPEAEKVWYKAFLESYVGRNYSDEFSYSNEAVEAEARRYKNNSDVMTVIGTRDRVSLEDYENSNYVKKAQMPEYPSDLQTREVHPIDLCDSSNINDVENAMIQVLDSVHFPKKTKQQLAQEKKERINRRKDTSR